MSLPHRSPHEAPLEKKPPQDHSLCSHPQSISLLGVGFVSPMLRMGSQGMLIGQLVAGELTLGGPV